MGWSTVAIWARASLPDLLTTVNITALEKSLLDIYKIVRLFVNALTPDDKDDLLNRDNLTQPIQRELSEKQKIFLTFFWIFKIFFTFWKFLWKNEPHSLRVSEIKGSKKHC